MVKHWLCVATAESVEVWQCETTKHCNAVYNITGGDFLTGLNFFKTKIIFSLLVMTSLSANKSFKLNDKMFCLYKTWRRFLT